MRRVGRRRRMMGRKIRRMMRERRRIWVKVERRREG